MENENNENKISIETYEKQERCIHKRFAYVDRLLADNMKTVSKETLVKFVDSLEDAINSFRECLENDKKEDKKEDSDLEKIKEDYNERMKYLIFHLDDAKYTHAIRCNGHIGMIVWHYGEMLYYYDIDGTDMEKRFPVLLTDVAAIREVNKWSLELCEKFYNEKKEKEDSDEE